LVKPRIEPLPNLTLSVRLRRGQDSLIHLMDSVGKSIESTHLLIPPFFDRKKIDLANENILAGNA